LKDPFKKELRKENPLKASKKFRRRISLLRRLKKGKNLKKGYKNGENLKGGLETPENPVNKNLPRGIKGPIKKGPRDPGKKRIRFPKPNGNRLKRNLKKENLMGLERNSPVNKE